MPVVHIYMYAGRSKEQKSEMVRRISKDFEEVLSIKPESLNVLFHDVEKSDWGIRGAWRDRMLMRLLRARAAAEP